MITIITTPAQLRYLVSAIPFAHSRFFSSFLSIYINASLLPGTNAIASTAHIDEYYNFDARKNWNVNFLFNIVNHTSSNGVTCWYWWCVPSIVCPTGIGCHPTTTQHIVVTCNLYDYYECKTQIGSNCCQLFGLKAKQKSISIYLFRKESHFRHNKIYFCQQTKYNELQFYSYNSLYLTEIE